MADFWGIEKLMPEMDDDMRTSLVILNSPKGERLFASICKYMVYKETELEEAITFNSAMISSVGMNPQRKDFFESLEQLEFDELVKKYCTDHVITKLKRIIRKCCSFFKHKVLRK